LLLVKNRSSSYNHFSSAAVVKVGKTTTNPRTKKESNIRFEGLLAAAYYIGNPEVVCFAVERWRRLTLTRLVSEGHSIHERVYAHAYSLVTLVEI
jgi:hypothetical protein